MPPPIRTCVASGQQYMQSDLMRFALTPDGALIADLAGKIPGRGAWVTPEPEAILQGLNNGGFSRTLKTSLYVNDQELLGVTTEQLKKRTLHSLHFCKKAGELISGHNKTKDQLKKDIAQVLIIASDASGDIKNTLLSAANKQVTIIEDFSREALAEIIGKENAVYVSLLGGDATNNFIKEYARFTRFRTFLAL